MAVLVQPLPLNDWHACNYEAYPEPAAFVITSGGPAVFYTCPAHVDEATVDAEIDEAENQ